MNVNRVFSSSEWQLLSAYLDDQLTEKEKNQVEELLQERPEAREALAALRRIRIMLKALPFRKASRNFTLAPAMVKKPILPPFVGVLRFSSALAGILLIAALALDFLTLNPPLAASRMAEQAAPEMLDMEAQAEEERSFLTQGVQSDKEGEPPPIIYWGAPPPVMGAYGKGGAEGLGYGVGGGDGAEYGIGGSGVVPEAPMLEAILPSEELAPVEETQRTGPEELAPPDEQPAALEPLSGSEPILGIRPPEERAAVPELLAEERHPVSVSASDIPIRLVEIILAVLLLVMGIPAWLLRRK